MLDRESWFSRQKQIIPRMGDKIRKRINMHKNVIIVVERRLILYLVGCSW